MARTGVIRSSHGEIEPRKMSNIEAGIHKRKTLTKLRKHPPNYSQDIGKSFGYSVGKMVTPKRTNNRMKERIKTYGGSVE